jgi:hypothetical protein
MTPTPAELIQSYHELRPTQYARFASLSIDQEADGQSLRLDLRSAVGAGRLVLRFSGVRDLKIDWPQWSQITVDVVEITDISDRGMEDLAFRVHEGAGLFAFSCRAFDATRE